MWRRQFVFLIIIHIYSKVYTDVQLAWLDPIAESCRVRRIAHEYILFMYGIISFVYAN